MGFKIFESIKATEDINAIVEYIQDTLSNPSAAESFLDDIQSCYNQLSDNPFVFQPGDGISMPRWVRHAVIKHYLVFFEINCETKTVNIARVVYGGRNYSDLF